MPTIIWECRAWNNLLEIEEIKDLQTNVYDERRTQKRRTVGRQKRSFVTHFNGIRFFSFKGKANNSCYLIEE